MNIFESVKSVFTGSEADTSVWNRIADAEEVDRIVALSEQDPQLIYKHSSRCGISSYTRSELERSAEKISDCAGMHFVEVVGSRDVSNYIAQKLSIRHESPQLILLKDGEVAWHGSHGAIKTSKVLDLIDK